ncbi:MAG TPA: outer membrane protein assembly factor BamD [Polyangiales bacterium]|nr:outer membrane protein assembly factor BamD [Polyangiales bacterium]
MRDPERLLSAADADPLERELLASLRDEHAPEHVRRAAWQGIAAGLATAAPATAAAATGAAAAPKAAALLVTKVVLVGALGAGVVSGAVWVSSRSAHVEVPVRQKAAPAAVAPRPSQPSAATATPSPPPPAAAEPARVMSKRPRVDALAAESALLQTARAELQVGQLNAAARAIKQLEHRFPHGVLGQEREVLQIELLRARGEHSAARELASRFLRAHPESPHAARLSRLMAAP